MNPLKFLLKSCQRKILDCLNDDLWQGYEVSPESLKPEVVSV